MEDDPYKDLEIVDETIAFLRLNGTPIVFTTFNDCDEILQRTRELFPDKLFTNITPTEVFDDPLLRWSQKETVYRTYFWRSYPLIHKYVPIHCGVGTSPNSEIADKSAYEMMKANTGLNFTLCGYGPPAQSDYKEESVNCPECLKITQ